jgi:RND family efflux transporter MFP subunit
MAKKTKKWLIIGVVIAVVVIGGLIYRSNSGKSDYETEEIGLGTVVEKVSVTGSIAPKTRINLQAEASARVIEIGAEEGDTVLEGDLLVKLDSSDLSARIAGAQASVASAQALLDQYRAGATPEELQVSQAALATAQANYNAALVSQQDAETSLATTKSKVAVNLSNKTDALLDAYDSALTAAADAMNRLTVAIYTGDEQLYYTVSVAENENQARSTRLLARSALVNLNMTVTGLKAGAAGETIAAASPSVLADLRTIKSNLDAIALMLNYAIYDATTVSTWQLNTSQAQSALNTNLQAVTTAKNNWDLQQNLNATEMNTAESALNSATNAVESARLAVDQAQANYDLKLAGTRPEQVAAQRAQVLAAQANLNQLYSDLAKRSIKAPMDGIVTEVMVEKGESLTTGAVAVMMQAEGKYEIVANISEVDIASIKVGNPVEITLDAFPSSEVWSGTIVSVWPAEKVVEGVIFYETKILFDEEDERIKSGMTANLEIETGRVENVLRLPLRALREESGQRYVLVLNEMGEAEERDIETGLENSEYFELVSGLSEGDAVVVGENKD